jgi:aspartyl aminopeptidase
VGFLVCAQTIVWCRNDDILWFGTAVVAGLVSVSACVAQQAADGAGDVGEVAAKSAWVTLAAGQKGEGMQSAEPYKDYLRHAKSAMLSEAELERLAHEAGFAVYSSAAEMKAGARLIIKNRGRAALFVVVRTDPIESGLRMVASHEDSPHINLKPRSVIDAPGSMALLKTMPYGGIKRYQWSNLPVALVGHIDTVDGRHIEVNIGYAPGDPVFVIADTAPHSDSQLRTRTYTGVFGGEEMSPVVGSIPGEKSTVAAEVMTALRAKYKIHDEDLVSSEL